MKVISSEKLQSLQNKPSRIRNICILAHVDHGKTTFADTLVASNGIISSRMAGKLRYMDSREDEQQRGITMKSSAIALYHIENTAEYLINLIDSPGHVDFSGEVSTAVRLCDGAIILVDVVEGVCPQTEAVIRQAWLENIKPVLVLNKIDRLILELKMTPMEAYLHLQQIVEQVNAVTAENFASQMFETMNLKEDEPNEDTDAELAEAEDDSNVYFSPEQENLIFASAIDGWGFSIGQFSEIIAKKIGCKADVLKKFLWGDYFFNAKTKRVMKGAQAKDKKPMFVQFILDNIWAVYDAVMIRKDKEMCEKIVNSLGLKIAPRDVRHADTRNYLQAILSQWLPLAPAAMSLIVNKLPSPVEISAEKVEKFMCNQAVRFDSLPPMTRSLREAFLACSNSDEQPVIAFVSKMFAVERDMLPQNKRRPLTLEEIQQRREETKHRAAEEAKGDSASGEANAAQREADGRKMPSEAAADQEDAASKRPEETFLAFARVFSGTLRPGQTLFVLAPKYNPSRVPNLDSIEATRWEEGVELPAHAHKVTISHIYLMMGRELEALDAVPAGSVAAIGGLQSVILKSATISSSLACPAFTELHQEAAPIVHVAVQPKNPADHQRLVEGLKMLNQADPCVEIRIQPNGDHVVCATGEVHLERCIEDLNKRFGKVEVNVSAPIIPFRETIVTPPKTDMVNEQITDDNQLLTTRRQNETAGGDAKGFIEMLTANKQCRLKIRAIPMPTRVTQMLVENEDLLGTLALWNQTRSKEDSFAISAAVKTRLLEFRETLAVVWNEHAALLGSVDSVWAFGPKRSGPNVLLNRVADYARPSLWEGLSSETEHRAALRELDNSVVSGFQMATLSGPLCEEPMMGVAFAIEEWADTNESWEEGTRDAYGPLSGQLMSAVKEGCRRAFQSRPQRLMAAMFKCQVRCTTEFLGKMYGVLSKRNGRVQKEEMKEGSNLFIVDAVLPVAESFGFAEEVRKKTSGFASPQLVFSHWEVVDLDPFWEPSTEEEYAQYGEKADFANHAKKYMNSVRKRKGLHVEEKLVQFAEKQRTLTKNK